MRDHGEHAYPSMLEGLPVELQDHIFRYLVINLDEAGAYPAPSEIPIHQTCDNNYRSNPRSRSEWTLITAPPSIPSAAQVSRWMRERILSIYFSENTFLLPCPQDTYKLDESVLSLRAWFDVFEQYARRTAHIGSECLMDSWDDEIWLFASVNKCNGSTYYYESTGNHADFAKSPGAKTKVYAEKAAPNIDRLTKEFDWQCSGLGTSIGKLVEACRSDLKDWVEDLTVCGYLPMGAKLRAMMTAMVKIWSVTRKVAEVMEVAASMRACIATRMISVMMAISERCAKHSSNAR